MCLICYDWVTRKDWVTGMSRIICNNVAYPSGHRISNPDTEHSPFLRHSGDLVDVFSLYPFFYVIGPLSPWFSFPSRTFDLSS